MKGSGRKKGRQHILRLIREVLYFKPSHKITHLESALDHVNEVVRRRSIVFIISDFLDRGYEKALRITSRRHDCIPIIVEDLREKIMPSVGFVELMDSETGKRILIDTRGKGFINNYTVRMEALAQRRRQLFNSMGLDYIELSTEKSYIEPLVQFFIKRAKRFH